jgi:DNA-binding NarL/FixJ family response regulator
MLHSLRTPARPRAPTSAALDESERAPARGASLPVAPIHRVLLIDAQPLFRRAVRDALDDHPQLHVVGETASGANAVLLSQELEPDIVVLDMRLPDVSGVLLTRQLVAALPDLRVVILSLNASDDLIVEAIRAGASGYLSKDIQPDALARAIAGVAAGEVAMSRRTAARVMERFRQLPASDAAQPPDLTTREIEVLRLLSQGATDREISERLVIAESTAKKHVQHILRKLRARNRAEAVGKYQLHYR